MKLPIPDMVLDFRQTLKARTVDIDVLVEQGRKIPEKAHVADAGFDLLTPFKFILWPWQRKTIDTGIRIFLPADLKAEVKAKSGLFRNHGILTTGLIDGEYTGCVCVTLLNTSWKPKRFKKDNKIAQLVVGENLQAFLHATDEIPETSRGDKGFGSTGR